MERTVNISSPRDVTDELLWSLAIPSRKSWTLNQWDGYDVYGDSNTFIRTTVEDGLYHVYGFDGYDMAWSIEFSDDTPDAIVMATVRAAYKDLG